MRTASRPNGCTSSVGCFAFCKLQKSNSQNTKKKYLMYFQYILCSRRVADKQANIVELFFYLF